MVYPFDIKQLYEFWRGMMNFMRLKQFIKNTINLIFNQPFTNMIPIPSNLDDKSLNFIINSFLRIRI